MNECVGYVVPWGIEHFVHSFAHWPTAFKLVGIWSSPILIGFNGSKITEISSSRFRKTKLKLYIFCINEWVLQTTTTKQIRNQMKWMMNARCEGTDSQIVIEESFIRQQTKLVFNLFLLRRIFSAYKWIHLYNKKTKRSSTRIIYKE